MAGPAVFVGRDNELSQLLAALGGESRLALVAGDAGVGKTRFVTEGMTRAAATGMVMVRGECLPLASTLPLLPVADALGELARLEDGRLLAALEAAPQFAGEEIGRLLPHLNPSGESGPDERDRGWRRERLFSAVTEVLEAVACRSAVGLVIEDVHWADHATLDCLTFLARPGRRSAVTVVVTCRSDEAPVAAHVGDWLTDVRGAADVEEIRLGPLSRADVAGQVAALTDGPVPRRVVDDLYARAEGNPFFTEQLVSAAAPGSHGDPLVLPAGLPARLAELLVARAARCAGDAQTVLAGLAVAGRPLAEDLLSAVTGLDAETVRIGLRELAAARLLAEDTADGGHRARAMDALSLSGDNLEAGELAEEAYRRFAAHPDPATAAVARRGIDAARQAGLEAWEGTGVLAYNAAEALLAQGRAAEAATLIDPLTSRPPDRDHWLLDVIRAEIDVLRGDIGAAARRRRLVYGFPTVISRVDFAYEAAPRTAEAELWAGHPGAAIQETRRALALFTVPDLTFLCGRLHFAWAGSAEPGRPHYYRIQGPRVLAEYDNTQRDANHVHAVWRDPAATSAATSSLTTTPPAATNRPGRGAPPAIAGCWPSSAPGLSGLRPAPRTIRSSAAVAENTRPEAPL